MKVNAQNLELPWTAVGVAFDLELGRGRGTDGDGGSGR